jgi:hypothetical protein
MDTEWLAAYDFKLRYNEVGAWFASVPVYEEQGQANYPPASYAVLWPLRGWLDTKAARQLWAAASAVALVALTPSIRMRDRRVHG